MTGEVAGAISGGLTVASMIVRMVHDMVRDAISDVIGKLASKVAIGVLTAGLAAPWAVSTAVTEVSSWVTRLSKEVADTVLSARNLKDLLSKANRLFDDVGTAFSRMASQVGESAAKRVDDLARSAQHRIERLGDFLTNPQYALAGAPGISMRRAGDMRRAKPTQPTNERSRLAKGRRSGPTLLLLRMAELPWLGTSNIRKTATRPSITAGTLISS